MDGMLHTVPTRHLRRASGRTVRSSLSGPPLPTKRTTQTEVSRRNPGPLDLLGKEGISRPV